ncbi:MAG: DUF4124 domain-containing protein [Halioglobus sp.]
MSKYPCNTVLIVLVALGILAASSTAKAEVFYRWLDDRGNPVLSDRTPPEGVDYEVVSTDSSLIRPVEAEEGAVPKTIKPTASNEFEPVKAQLPEIKKNPVYCGRAKENLTVLDTKPRIRIKDDDGEIRFLTDEERTVKREEALKSMEAYCE